MNATSMAGRPNGAEAQLSSSRAQALRTAHHHATGMQVQPCQQLAEADERTRHTQASQSQSRLSFWSASIGDSGPTIRISSS